MKKTTAARFSSFEDIAALCNRFVLEDFNKPARVKEYVAAFNLSALCRPLAQDKIKSATMGIVRSVSSAEEKPYEVKYGDVCRLHWLALTRKAIHILELGSGYSTVMLADAMSILDHYFFDWARKNTRTEQPFHLFSVDESARFVQLTKQRLAKVYNPFVTLQHSPVELTLFDDRFATVYTKLPNICPDLIYLDGPSQYATDEEINGFSIASPVRMPMSADILRFEFFLEPGALILVDGRTANARFLKAHMKRNWAYWHDTVGDVHFFELQENPLGRFNKKKIEFCLNNKWLLNA